MKSFLQIQNMDKIFHTGDKPVIALKDINFKLNRTEFVVIMGPSGSGKSTFLQILGVIEAPTSGEIKVEGLPINNFYSEPQATEFRRKNVGFIFQSFNLLSSLNAEDNIALPLILAGNKKDDIQEKTQQMLRMVGLEDR